MNTDNSKLLMQMFWLLMGVGYLIGALVGFMTALFELNFAIVIIPIVVGLAYMAFKTVKSMKKVVQ